MQGNYLTQIDLTARINKAASDTKVVKSSRVRAGKPVIPSGQVKRDALVCSSFFSHGLNPG